MWILWRRPLLTALGLLILVAAASTKNLKYQQKHPTLKQIDVIKYFNKVFSVNIPATTMSGILSLSNRNKILKQDNVEAFNKRIREWKKKIHLLINLY